MSWLRGCFLLLLGLFGAYFLSYVRYSYLHFLFRFFYELFCYPFSPPSFGADLCHLHFWRSPSLLMHCYVFFLAGCFHAYFLGVFVGVLSLHFSIFFMTLTLVLGCFPLDLGPYRSKSVYFFSLFSYSWVFTLLNLLVPYTSIQPFETRYLYSFRRKPAISKFDWHFTSMHKSSQIIATITSSFLLHLLRVLSNCSCIDHLVSGPIFVDFFVFTSLSLAHLYLLQIHYTKGTSFFSWLLWFRWFPGLFHLSLAILFTFHSRYSFSIGVSLYLVLEVWFPFLQTSSWCSTLFRCCCLTGLVYPLCSGFLRFDFSWFARHYFTYLSWFLFLWVLRCFSSPGFLFWGFPLRIP